MEMGRQFLREPARVIAAACGVVALMAGLMARPAMAQSDVDTKAVVQAANQFGVDLYGRVSNQPGNLFLSPYSVDTALAMVLAGARGPTAAQMSATLHLPALKPADLQAAFGDLIRRYQASKAEQGYELHVANALWAAQNAALLPDYVQLLDKDYSARLTTVDFSNPTAAAATINDWVARQTKDRIKDLISPSGLDQNTRLILTNAIYFKGTWAAPFKADATADAPWHGADAGIAHMMHQTSSYPYFEDDQLSALQLPYDGDRVAMLVLLPKETDGLGKLEKSLDTRRLQAVIDGLRQQDVVASLPKFRVESRFSLSRSLSEMGMPLAFSSSADFSGISAVGHLYVSEVVHKAFVEVDEQGTEAAAATGVTMRALIYRPHPIFNADQPFLFLIRDVKDQTVLFIGRLEKP
jgi:serpin B